eukprot:3503697-Prymnesium_polylepis.1
MVLSVVLPSRQSIRLATCRLGKLSRSSWACWAARPTWTWHPGARRLSASQLYESAVALIREAYDATSAIL